jgi:hypothetical protein
MIDDILLNGGNIPGWILILLVLGSSVDLVQFSWMIKRRWRKIRLANRHRIKRELLLEMHELQKENGKV